MVKLPITTILSEESAFVIFNSHLLFYLRTRARDNYRNMSTVVGSSLGLETKTPLYECEH